MAIDPISYNNRCTHYTKTPERKPIPSRSLDLFSHSKYISKAKIDSSDNLILTRALRGAFDSDIWYTINDEGKAQSQTCWSQPEELKGSYIEIYNKAKAENQRYGNISDETAKELIDELENMSKKED